MHSKAAEKRSFTGGFGVSGDGVKLDLAGFAVAGFDGVYDAGADFG